MKRLAAYFCTGLFVCLSCFSATNGRISYNIQRNYSVPVSSGGVFSIPVVFKLENANLVQTSKALIFNITVDAGTKPRYLKRISSAITLMPVDVERLKSDNDSIVVEIVGQVANNDIGPGQIESFQVEIALFDKDMKDLLVPNIKCVCIVSFTENKSKDNLLGTGLRLSLGTNVDFQTGTQVSSFYGRLSYYLPSFSLGSNPLDPSIEHAVKDYSPFTLGLYTGVYQNKYNTHIGDAHHDSFFGIAPYTSLDSIRMVRHVSTETEVTAVTNLGFYLSIPLAMFRSEFAKSRCLVSLAPQFECISRTTETKYDYKDDYIDTAMVKSRAYYDSLSKAIPSRFLKSSTLDVTCYTYYGLEANMSYHSTYVTMFLRVMVGDRAQLQSGQDAKWSSYAAFSLSATENNLGLRIGGEVRFEADRQPFNVYMTKNFNLEDLFKERKSAEP